MASIVNTERKSMSRKVDLDNLSEDDARYLHDRPDLINEARLQGVYDIEDRITEAFNPEPEVEVEETEGVEVTRNYEGLNLGDLRKLAESRGVPATGSKATLVSRLEAADVATGVTSTVSREAEESGEALAEDESE